MTSLSNAPPVDQRACVVCGDTSTVRHCFIVPQDEPDTWSDLKSRGWIPQTANRSPGHEPRNGMPLCPNHFRGFNEYGFYIRFSPEARKFLLVNFSNYDSFAPFHGKVIALDANDLNAPFASLFVIHEWRVRGFHPFNPIAPTIPGGPTTAGVMNDDVIAEVLEATRAQPSWKACGLGNTDEDDTAEENV